MKKVIFLLLIITIMLSGCAKKSVEKEKEVIKEEPVNTEEVKYIDNNNTPISFYEVNNRTLTKIHSTDSKIGTEVDIGVFSIFPSTEETITLTDSYANSFYNEWMKYNTNNNLKIGFNIKYNDISFNILKPDNCFDHYLNIMTYLYDDYANRGKSFYSHIENNEYTDSTLFTSIKLQAAYELEKLYPKVELTVFTYDNDDDFLDNEYRGNSKYSIIINTK